MGVRDTRLRHTQIIILLLSFVISFFLLSKIFVFSQMNFLSTRNLFHSAMLSQCRSHSSTGTMRINFVRVQLMLKIWTYLYNWYSEVFSKCNVCAYYVVMFCIIVLMLNSYVFKLWIFYDWMALQQCLRFVFWYRNVSNFNKLFLLIMEFR